MLRIIAVTDLFFQELRVIDHDHFLLEKAKRCPLCGDKLDTANYGRKLRGGGNGEHLRYSLCCRRDGCRTRVTTRSLRFFGRKVYSAWVVILSVDFMKELGLKGEPARQTIARWKNMWRERLSEQNPFMLKARSFLPPGHPVCDSPASLLPLFKFPEKSSWLPVLNFFII